MVIIADELPIPGRETDGQTGRQASKPTPLTMLPLPCPPWEFPLLLYILLLLALALRYLHRYMVSNTTPVLCHIRRSYRPLLQITGWLRWNGCCTALRHYC
jgi:hypothetical protein